MTNRERWDALAAEHPEDFEWFDGTPYPVISGGGPSGKSTTTVVTNVPPKTDEEIALLRKQNEFLDLQLTETRRQSKVLEEAFPAQVDLLRAQTAAATAFAQAQKIQLEAVTPLLGEQAAFQRESIDLARRSAKLQEELTTRALAEIEGTPEEREIRKLSNERALAILRGEAPPLLPGQRERIEEVFGRAKEEAESGLRTFGENLAAERGMRLTDSPIGGELLRQGRELARDLSSAKARAELDVGQAQQVFSESVRQFQENLRQRGIENRMALTGRNVPLMSLPLPGASPVFSTGLPLAGFEALTPAIGQMAQERIAGATQTTRGRTSTTPGILDYVKLLTSAAGGLAAAGAFSSATLKRDIDPLDVDEYERARRTVRELPIVRYRYKHEDDSRPAPHIGPLAETLPDEVREGKLRVNLLDLTGLTLAAVKGVDRRMDRIEARLPVERTERRTARLPVPARAA